MTNDKIIRNQESQINDIFNDPEIQEYIKKFDQLGDLLDAETLTFSKIELVSHLLDFHEAIFEAKDIGNVGIGLELITKIINKKVKFDKDGIGSPPLSNGLSLISLAVMISNKKKNTIEESAQLLELSNKRLKQKNKAIKVKIKDL